MENVKLFISYRREDSDFATHAIYEKLAARFGGGSVFVDVDTIPPGVDFREYLQMGVAQCDVLLAIIGKEWLNVRSADGSRRLDDPRDFVRIEIEAALQRNIPVVPVLLGRVVMPNEDEMPDTLRAFAYRQALELRAGRDFDSDVQRLVDGIEQLLQGRRQRDQITPGHVKQNSTGMMEVLLPAGTLLMGSPESDSDASDDEKPQHEVIVSAPFWLGQHPVTQEQYEQLMRSNPSKYAGASRPVDTVSLADAAQFCNRLSQRENLLPYYSIDDPGVVSLGGNGYRIPSEFEWEYACRAGTNSRWSFGDDVSELGHYAWYHENSDELTHPVGTKECNAWQLFDMHGNVWEVCWDVYRPYQLSEGGKTARQPSGNERVLRGGSFAEPAWGVRSAYRISIRPAVRSSRTGMRVARDCYQ